VRDFRLLVAAVFAMQLAAQMVAVAIGWQVYELDENAFHLGLVGLAEFLPLLLLALPAGELADRLPRRAIFAAAVVLEGAVACGLIALTLAGASQLWAFLALAFGVGVAGALGNPAARALPPALVPVDLLAGAFALRSVATRVGAISGPAIGGVLFAIRPEVAYATAAALFGLALACVLALRAPAIDRDPLAEPPPGLQSILAGIRLIRRTPVLLGAITLDLFAVLFGGAVALLPLFAKDILEVGPVGLGLLRAAIPAGGLLAAALLSVRPLGGRAGRTLLVVVAAFGACMVVFGLSRSFALSLAALAAAGFVDMISVNIRATVVALVTPDDLRGRVLAVEMVFISGSNELGAFESGVAAALIGAVPAVVAGGAVTILLALVWTRFFPELTAVDRLEDLRPVTAVA
jgi:MFS family permease